MIWKLRELNKMRNKCCVGSALSGILHDTHCSHLHSGYHHSRTENWSLPRTPVYPDKIMKERVWMLLHDPVRDDPGGGEDWTGFKPWVEVDRTPNIILGTGYINVTRDWTKCGWQVYKCTLEKLMWPRSSRIVRIFIVFTFKFLFVNLMHQVQTDMI